MDFPCRTLLTGLPLWQLSSGIWHFPMQSVAVDGRHTEAVIVFLVHDRHESRSRPVPYASCAFGVDNRGHALERPQLVVTRQSCMRTHALPSHEAGTTCTLLHWPCNCASLALHVFKDPSHVLANTRVKHMARGIASTSPSCAAATAAASLALHQDQPVQNSSASTAPPRKCAQQLHDAPHRDKVTSSRWITTLRCCTGTCTSW